MRFTNQVRLVPAIVGAVAMLALSGCTAPVDAEITTEEATLPVPSMNESLAAKLPDKIRERGTLKVHTTTDYAPINFASESGEPMGFSIDLGNAVGHVLGVEIDWQVGSFDNLIPGINAGRFDISMASYYASEERMKVVDFVQYINGGAIGAVTPDNAEKYREPLDLCGSAVGVVQGTMFVGLAEDLSNECIENAKEGVEISSFPSGNDALSALRSGRIDFHVHTTGGLYFASMQQPGEFSIIGDEFWPDYYGAEGVVLAKDSPLTSLISDTINELIEDGTYDAILDKWNLKAVGVESAEINPRQ